VPPSRARLLGWAAVLVFASGLCAVTYQVAWLRLLRLVFGASTTANATVLAIFMGGLGLGGLLLGRMADRWRNPLDLYGRLEIAIGVAAGLTPWLITGVRAVYVGLGGTARLGDLGGNLPFLGYRSDPWPIQRIFIQALRAAREIASDDPDNGRRLFDAIREPFTLDLLDDERRSALVALAFAVDLERLCVEAFRQFEPYPSWNETFLAQRVECYRKTGSPLLAAAERDLGDFRESAPPSLEISPPPAA
jgi:hypothetical protein